MHFLWLCICTLLLAVFIRTAIKIARNNHVYSRVFSSDKILPLGKTHPIWGHMHLFSDPSQFHQLLYSLISKTGARMTYQWVMFLFPLITACHTESAKIVLKATHSRPKQTGGSYFAYKPWLGDGLLLSDNKKWHRNRRLLTPAFHFDILKPYVAIYNKVFNEFLDIMETETADGKGVEIHEPAKLATLDTMLRCAFSYHGNIQQQGSKHPYCGAIRTLIDLSVERLLKPWLHPDILFRLSSTGRTYLKTANYVHEFAGKIIRERKASLKDDPSILQKRHLDFLDILLSASDEDGTGLTSEEIRDEVNTFLFAGHDTTSSAISWAIYALAKYPEEQLKVYQEVKEVLGDRKEVEWSDIQKFQRMSLFLKESMRMYTPVPVIARMTTCDLDIDGVTIPANSEILVLLHVINNREDIWENPKVFRPERFLDEPDRDSFAYIPFSAGSRNCIGQHFALNELKTAIAMFIQRFHVRLDEENETIMQEAPIMSSKTGIHVKLQKR